MFSIVKVARDQTRPGSLLARPRGRLDERPWERGCERPSECSRRLSVRTASTYCISIVPSPWLSHITHISKRLNIRYPINTHKSSLHGVFTDGWTIPASRGFSRRGKMKRTERDPCRLPTSCLMKPPTKFLVETYRALKLNSCSRSPSCFPRDKNVTGC